MRKLLRFTGLIVLGLLGVLVVFATASALANSRLPTASAAPAELSAAERARLAEFYHLHESLGDGAWPGFGRQPVPVVIYNEATVFLTGLDSPAEGWRTVPDGRARGGPWEPASGEPVAGRTVYHQPLPSSGATPQAFTVQIGDEWAASLTTMEWMRIGLANQIRSEMPGPIAAVFPYSLFMDQLVSGSDQFISLIAHEAFHAYQGRVAPERLAASEHSVRESDSYPWDDAAATADWQTELDLLVEALAAEEIEDAADVSAAFLSARRARRAETGLSESQVAFEQHREWSEGLARYVELAIWRAAATGDYQPTPAITDDPDFDNYQGYDRRWQRELDQIGRMAGDPGDGRFYYTGMAMAMLIDRMVPDWQSRVMEPGVFLEDLLAEGVARYASDCCALP